MPFSCVACDAMMPWCHVFVLTYFLLLAVLLAAACLVVEVAAGPVNRLLLACLFCEFSHPPSLDLYLGGRSWCTSEVNSVCPPGGVLGLSPCCCGGWPWPVGWATPVVYPKVENVAADLPLVAGCCCLDLLSRDMQMQTYHQIGTFSSIREVRTCHPCPVAYHQFMCPRCSHTRSISFINQF